MTGLSRRTLFGGAAAATALGLAGCSRSGSGTTSSSAAAGKANLPTYIPYEGVKPDLAAGGPGQLNAFFKYPSPPQKQGKIPLPQVERIRWYMQGADPGTLHDQNPYWKQLETDSGAGWTLTTGGYGQPFRDKFQVLVASGDLPEVTMWDTGIAKLPQLLESKFVNLGDFIGGDKVKDYPNLASIPTMTWQLGAINGILYGITQPRAAVGNILNTRADLLKPFGLPKNPQIADGKALLDLLKLVNQPDKGAFALGNIPTGWFLPMVLEMMEAPNGWRRESDGTFVSQYESEQMPEALAITAQAWKDRLLHPLSFTDYSKNSIWWQAGTTILYQQAFAGWATFQNSHPDWDMGVIELPKWNGGGLARKWLGPAGFGMPAIISKQKSDDRVREILRVLDYIAAPFGTEEWLRVNYGVEGTTYTMTENGPKALEAHGKMIPGNFFYAGGQGNNNLYVPGMEASVREQYAYMQKVLANNEANAATGLYSETELGKGATEAKKLVDLQGEIIQGRQPVSAWDAAVKAWKSAAGDQIRKEYADGYAASR